MAEVYRRMSLRHQAERPRPAFAEIENDSRVLLAVSEYSHLLPTHKTAAILDIGFGGGWFMAACLKLGYSNISGADFGISNKSYIRAWSKDIVALHEIENDIGDFLSHHPEEYDFIHMSHVIEHIPKYSLLWVVDALYRALKKARRADAANAQHGRPHSQLQLLRYSCSRVWVLRVKPEIAIGYLRIR